MDHGYVLACAAIPNSPLRNLYDRDQLAVHGLCRGYSLTGTLTSASVRRSHRTSAVSVRARHPQRTSCDVGRGSGSVDVDTRRPLCTDVTFAPRDCTTAADSQVHVVKEF
jgi:hypothetical protein